MSRRDSDIILKELCEAGEILASREKVAKLLREATGDENLCF